MAHYFCWVMTAVTIKNYTGLLTSMPDAMQAATQVFTTIAALLDKPLATDGDLLIYDKQGKPTSTISNSEQAINEVMQKYQLDASTDQIRTDLLQEKQSNFHRTVTYRTVTQHYQKLMNKPAPFATVPDIVSTNEKAIRAMSTKKFTDQVNQRYQQCLNKQ